MSLQKIRILNQVSESLNRTSSDIQVVLSAIASTTKSGSIATPPISQAPLNQPSSKTGPSLAAPGGLPVSGGSVPAPSMSTQQTPSGEQQPVSSSGAFLSADELFPIDEGKPRGMSSDDTNRVSRLGRNIGKAIWRREDSNDAYLTNVRQYIISVKKWRSKDETKILFTYRRPPRNDDSDISRMIQRAEIVIEYVTKNQTETNWDVFREMIHDFSTWIGSNTIDLNLNRKQYIANSFRIKNGVPVGMEKVDNRPTVPTERFEDLWNIMLFAEKTRAMRKEKGPKYYTYAVDSGEPDNEIDGMLNRMEKVMTFVIENWSEKNDKVVQDMYENFLKFSDIDGVGLDVREVAEKISYYSTHDRADALYPFDVDGVPMGMAAIQYDEKIISAQTIQTLQRDLEWVKAKETSSHSLPARRTLGRMRGYIEFVLAHPSRRNFKSYKFAANEWEQESFAD